MSKTNDLEKMEMVIVMDGGLIQDILSTHAVEVVVKDYDTEGGDAERISTDREGGKYFGFRPTMEVYDAVEIIFNDTMEQMKETDKLSAMVSYLENEFNNKPRNSEEAQILANILDTLRKVDG
jgi:hypothetical protein